MKIAWDDSLAIGVAEIDDQHRRIFDNFNAFSVACTEGHGAEKLNELFWFLGSYIAIHFAEEERLMQKVGFPDYPNHHKLHSAFTSQVDVLMERFIESGPSHEIAGTVGETIKNWLIEHISLTDCSIGRFIREHRQDHVQLDRLG